MTMRLRTTLLAASCSLAFFGCGGGTEPETGQSASSPEQKSTGSEAIAKPQGMVTYEPPPLVPPSTANQESAKASYDPNVDGPPPR